MIIKLSHEIKNDKYTEYIYNAFDIQNKVSADVVVAANLENIPKDFNIGVVYGGSGSGKTTILKNYFKKEFSSSLFDNSKSLISNFDWLEPEEAGLLLSAMGLSSVPTWLRPYSTLSNGEKYRANLAFVAGKAKENEIILVDEYTSVVDRDVAKAMSNALQKYVRKTNKKIVLASCHFDIMEWLQPDWIYSPLKGRLEIAPQLRRPEIKLSIVRCRVSAWHLFKQHHYLKDTINEAAKTYIALFNEKPVCFMGILPMPSGTVKNAYRVTRLVVLPDFQGLGVGMKVLNYFGSMYLADGKTLYIKTSAPSLFKGMEFNTKNWECITKGIRTDVEKIKAHNKKLIEEGKDNGIKCRKESVTKSYKYIGEPTTDNINLVKFKSDVYKEVAQNQISLF